MTTIYKLIDPRTNSIRYVGRTNRTLKERLQSHVGASHNRSSNFERWMFSFYQKNNQPIILPITKANPKNADKRERYWIKKLSKEGHPLLNRFHVFKPKIKPTYIIVNVKVPISDIANDNGVGCYLKAMNIEMDKQIEINKSNKA